MLPQTTTMTTMNCKRAKQYIALSIGGDLDPGLRWPLKQHLAGCLDCRAFFRQMKQCITQLREPPLAPPQRDAASVWPAVVRKLPQRARALRKERFNGWVAGLSVALACSVLVVYAVTYESPTAIQPLVSDPIAGTNATFAPVGIDRGMFPQRPGGVIPGQSVGTPFPTVIDEEQLAPSRKAPPKRTRIEEFFDAP